MRRTLVVLLVATTCSLQFTAGVAQAGTLKVSDKTPTEGHMVEITGTTGCNKRAGIYLRSSPRSVKTSTGNKVGFAIMPRNVGIRSNGAFSTTRRIRETSVASDKLDYLIVSSCKNAKGQRSGKYKITVLPFTGLPVLPQLLAGLGLIGSGTGLLRCSRRAGASGSRRRRSIKAARARREGLIARWALKAD
jgi:hypothetical protein